MKNDPQAGGTGLDKVRQATIDRLCERFAEDRLSMHDFERRLDLAHRATTTRQLAALVAGFPPTAQQPAGGSPAPATPARPNLPANCGVPRRGCRPGSSWRASWERARGAGRGSRPARCMPLALMGGVELDFREAAFGPGVTEVTVFALWGGVDIVVPPGLQVECSGAGIMGAFERTPDELADASVASSDPGSPVLRVNGVALMGGVDVSTRLPGEREKDAARRRKLARKARRKELRGW